MGELVVADAGPLIALGLIDAPGLLAAAHRRVVVPHEVERKCLMRPEKPAAAAIEWAFAQGWLSEPDACRAVVGLYARDDSFRSRVAMAQHGFERGEYRGGPKLVGGIR